MHVTPYIIIFYVFFIILCCTSFVFCRVSRPRDHYEGFVPQTESKRQNLSYYRIRQITLLFI